MGAIAASDSQLSVIGKLSLNGAEVTAYALGLMIFVMIWAVVASISGTDVDFVVKVIDVYPDEVADEIGEIASQPAASPDNSDTPVPTLSTEIDDEGTVIPRAVPVPEP